MQSETPILKTILLKIGSLPYCRLFRNNTGMGWSGQSYQQGSSRVVLNAFPLKAGLCTGSSDLIGITQITITPDMIGKKIGIFTALETKTLKGKASEDQKKFIAMVQQFGGISGVVRNEHEAMELIEKFKER